MHPRYRSHVPLSPDADPEERLDGQWRRNLRKASGSGVDVRTGGADDLPSFYALYAETAGRDGFPPLPLEFFERMWASLTGEDPERLALYLAERDGHAYAAALRTRVGDVVSYTHGASSAAGREWRPSNAMQWRMLTDARAAGASVYDLRGISDTLDPDDPLFGLLRFKLGLGGDAVELAGEWRLPFRPVRHRVVARPARTTRAMTGSLTGELAGLTDQPRARCPRRPPGPWRRSDGARPGAVGRQPR